ncbi:hypothetical protein AU467_16540 [Mesorhizobium loti]|uniref:Uncharacterized protein n=1 Tax=Rhizobium loti TaxID=381 RepID=A0A101KV20_RHILI|nr:hypothetical protein AU467_16540 [Mesorhizobium loti]
MPNLKIFVDETLYPECRDKLAAAMEPIRSMLCEELKVDVPACQFALLPVMAMNDLPRVNAEMQILPKPERTRDQLIFVSRRLQDMLRSAAGTHVAVRVTALDPQTYIALK